MQSPGNMLRAAVEGYAGGRSYAPGETLTVHCTADVPSFDIEIARCGRTREVVWTAEGIEGHQREIPADVGARGCGWPSSFELVLPPDWRPGYYEVSFAWPGKDDRELNLPAFFVLRSSPERPRPPILLLLTDTTYNAYNDWNHSRSLYTGGSHVSFERPFAPGFLTRPPDLRLRAATAMGTFDPAFRTQRATVDAHRLSGWCYGAGFYQWERPFITWAEEEGIELDFAVSSDLEFRPEVLDGRQLVVSVGHDEYWSWAMRDSMEEFITGGGNVMFLTGNAVFWQVRFEDEGRVMVSYKYAAPREDPLRGTERQSGMWSDSVVGRPENQLTGVSFTHGGYVRAGHGVARGPGGYLVWRPDHWIFEGTDVRYGDLIGAEYGVIGYEADGCELTYGEDGLPVPTHRDGTPESFEILATSPARLWANEDLPPTNSGVDGDLSDLGYTQWRVFGVDPRVTPESEMEPRVRAIGHGNAVMGMYTRGGTVFTSGCTDWGHGIEGRDPIIVAITRNLMTRLGGASRRPGAEDGAGEARAPSAEAG
ncbi:N,N-dimethylformamidase beta subunit family domain-containing protein [Nonomuraea cavernae]|uniref:N,N-dimethylformamidase beta subunit family domain-containing protein n=1 Tax=Nonomuraea cavernae TaxID=2045107 RepID=UPI0033DB186D